MPNQDSCDIFLGHAKHIIKAEFAVSAPHEKRIAVKQKQHGKQGNDGGAHRQHPAQHRSSPDLVQRCRIGEEEQKIAHHAKKCAAEEKRNGKAAVFPQAVGCKARIEKQLHCLSPPVVSIVSVSEIA